MMTILAGILSLGNIAFETTDSDALKVSEASRGWLKATAVSFLFASHRCWLWQHHCLNSQVDLTRGGACDSSQPL